MAGAGYKLFNTGDVLTAAQVNTYLQEQAVMRFANAAARTTALASVLAEGMVSYLQDTDAVEVYNGTAWVGVASGDITAVTAGTGLSGGGTTGAVTLSLSTPVAETNGGTAQTTYATGDLLYASGTNTLAKRSIGTTGQVLTVSGGVPTWSTPAAGGGGKVLQVVSATTNTQVVNTSTSTYADTGLTATITPTASSSKILVIITQAIECDISSGSTGTEANAAVSLLRGATEIWQANRAISVVDQNTNAHFLAAHISITCYDSPATTSATTYKTQFRPYNGANRANAQWANEMRSTITLMEIGA